MGRYRTWGLDSPRSSASWDDAICRGKSQMYFTRNPTIAAQAIHLCSHCPVSASCRREAENRPPTGAVQAGIWYAEANNCSAGPRKRQPAAVGCGPWCAHLRQRTEQHQ